MIGSYFFNFRDNSHLTQELFLEPYCLSETGQIYDADGIFIMINYWINAH